ncbi:GL21004 [Drosophila persimilis]|uniref:Mannosyltransferase n=1 Tax=Drosophila persimilis TaxID=7234 RepID=B4H818_DROPE|nr:GL21004 [Drosophila persimilis]
MNLLYVFGLILAVRLASVFVVKTYYVPDEYWQSLEVAHKLTFGYGYLTWEWVQGIRSYVYPVLIAGLYKLLALLHLDSVQLLVLLPRILQATLTAYSDYRFYVWTGKRKWALFLILVPWFWFYTGSRTLANTLEASLTTIALSYFPWYGEGTAYLWPAAICCFLRPTASVIWLPLSIYHLRKSRQSVVELILKRFLVIGLLVAGLGIAIDTYWHGHLIVTPYEFLKYNIFNNIGSFYGSHPWYWYFTVGLPTVLGINTLPFIYGIMETVRKSEKHEVSKQLLITIFLTLVVLSTVEHKEFRFVSSLLPLCLYVCVDAVSRWSYRASSTMLWCSAFVILLGNVLPAWYLSTVHQKGPIDLMPKLRDIAQEYRDEREHRANILFLMPCHSTPFYSDDELNIMPRDNWARRSLRRTPTSSGRRQISTNALASQLYRSSSFNSSGRSSNCDTTEDMYSDISLENRHDYDYRLELLQRKVDDLSDTQNIAEDRTTRTKTEYAVLQARYHMLEEQFRESELRAEERLAEEQKRHREILARVEREASLQNENCQMKIRATEIEANALRDEAQRLRVQCDKQANDLHRTEEQLELARDQIAALQQEYEEQQQTLRKQEMEKKSAEELMLELSGELQRAREENGARAMPTTSPESIRLEELHQELEEMRQKNRSLEEQNEELQATMLTNQVTMLSTGVEQGRHLLNGTLGSLAQELEEMSQAQLQQAFQEKDDENVRLKHYIDTILLNIVENYPQLLEVKPMERK